jgi:hypothetical protein
MENMAPYGGNADAEPILQSLSLAKSGRVRSAAARQLNQTELEAEPR